MCRHQSLVSRRTGHDPPDARPTPCDALDRVAGLQVVTTGIKKHERKDRPSCVGDLCRTVIAYLPKAAGNVNAVLMSMHAGLRGRSMIARRERTAGFFARRLGALVAWAALTAAASAAAPVAAAESGDNAGGSPDISTRAFSASSSGPLASASGNFSRFATGLNQVLTRLPPDARRHLVMGALLLFI